MEKARDIMTRDAQCIQETETLLVAAQKMRDLDIGAMPICGADGKLKGMLTDRDIVVGCIAEGGDPSTATAAEFARGKPVTIGADDSVEEAMRTMAEHQVRRLPVIDGHQLVGIISEQNIAQGGKDRKVGDTVESVTKG
ncbi:CBS domain-containing protein [Georgenia subflava]|uniref:CBS domain-containing protein n=1 Tax=Georgenia subflava TaxID=1622177 RepID=A0A6N7EK84_9MICO|nr:CBS domain-containing protein [Georgenia subflava]MPV36606.1 CBS domain-containing protein [Georgenia subflava]